MIISRFCEKLDITAMPILRPLPIKTKGKHWWHIVWIWFISRREWELMEDYFYIMPDGTVLFVPKGFVFDGASIPRVFWLLLSPTGLLLIPSLFHDYMYTHGFIVRALPAEDALHTSPVSRKYADDLFVTVALAVNGIRFVAWGAWAAVRVFGKSCFNC